MKKRIDWIDVAKGICMIAIVLGHLGDKGINRIVYSFHLPVLFILSGYTLREQETNATYLNNKFNRLMKPYFTTCLLICFFDLVNNFIDGDYSVYTASSVITKDLIRSYMASGSIKEFGKINIGTRIGALWFLPAMFFGLLFTQIILSKTKDWKKRFVYGCLLCLIANSMRYFLWLPFSILSGLFSVIYILFGKWLKDQEILTKLNTKHYIVFLIVFLIGCYLDKTYIYMVSTTVADYIISPICSLASSLLIIRLSMLIEKSKFFKWIGINSILVLQIHIIELEAGSKWYHLLLNDTENLLLWAVAWLLTIIIILIFKECINSLKKKRCLINKNENMNISVSEHLSMFKCIMLIILLWSGFRLDKIFFKVLNSVNMIGLIVIYGYESDFQESKKKTITYYFKNFGIPLLVYLIVILCKDKCSFDLIFKEISFSIYGNIVNPIGLVFIILIDSLILNVIDEFRLNSEWMIFLLVIGLSLTGYTIVKNGIFLPLHFETSLYCSVFYYVGKLVKKYDVLRCLRDHRYIYFITSTIWAFTLFYNSIDIASKSFNDYGFYIIGSIAGILIIFQVCFSICETLSKSIKTLIEVIGSSTIYILISSYLLSNKLHFFASEVLGLSPANIPFLVAVWVMQVIAGCMVFQCFSIIENKMLHLFSLEID